MKIFSNFDTQFKYNLYNKFVQKYWKDNVIIITRDKIFLYLHVLLPSILYLILLIFLFLIWFLWDWESFNNIKWVIIFILIFFTFIPFAYKIIKRLIDYYMDFAIITPREIVAYNQTWIFSRDSRSIDVDKIKSITIDKKWFINSLFNFWSIVFLSEWSDDWNWDIKLDFVHNPDLVRHKIIDLVKFWEEN